MIAHAIMQSGYSIAQVARACGVSYRTIKRRVDEGLIPARRYGPKTTRIDRTTLIRLKQYGLNLQAFYQEAGR